MMLVYGQDIDDASPTVSIAFKENSGNYDLSRVAMFFKKGEYDDWSSLFITQVSARIIPPRLGSMLVLLQSWGMFVHVARRQEASQFWWDHRLAWKNNTKSFCSYQDTVANVMMFASCGA